MFTFTIYLVLANHSLNCLFQILLKWGYRWPTSAATSEFYNLSDNSFDVYIPGGDLLNSISNPDSSSESEMEYVSHQDTFMD